MLLLYSLHTLRIKINKIPQQIIFCLVLWVAFWWCSRTERAPLQLCQEASLVASSKNCHGDAFCWPHFETQIVSNFVSLIYSGCSAAFSPFSLFYGRAFSCQSMQRDQALPSRPCSLVHLALPELWDAVCRCLSCREMTALCDGRTVLGGSAPRGRLCRAGVPWGAPAPWKGWESFSLANRLHEGIKFGSESVALRLFSRSLEI